MHWSACNTVHLDKPTVSVHDQIKGNIHYKCIGQLAILSIDKPTVSVHDQIKGNIKHVLSISSACNTVHLDKPTVSVHDHIKGHYWSACNTV